MAAVATSTHEQVALAERWSAHNYHPLPVVLTHGEGAWLTDVDGRRYLDFLAEYSALNFGHRHPALVAAVMLPSGRAPRGAARQLRHRGGRVGREPKCWDDPSRPLTPVQ